MEETSNRKRTCKKDSNNTCDDTKTYEEEKSPIKTESQVDNKKPR